VSPGGGKPNSASSVAQLSSFVVIALVCLSVHHKSSKNSPRTETEKPAPTTWGMVPSSVDN
jgi:hypothetical protein